MAGSIPVCRLHAASRSARIVGIETPWLGRLRRPRPSPKSPAVIPLRHPRARTRQGVDITGRAADPISEVDNRGRCQLRRDRYHGAACRRSSPRPASTGSIGPSPSQSFAADSCGASRAQATHKRAPAGLRAGEDDWGHGQRRNRAPWPRMGRQSGGATLAPTSNRSWSTQQ
jgi:hypothetical protein